MTSPGRSTGSRRKLLIAAIGTASSLGAADRTASADVIAGWNNGGGGNWASSANWSPDSNYPNNDVPPGVDYQANISLSGTKAYVVTVNSNIAVDALSINSANATLADTANTLTLGGVAITAGVFQLNGGTLSGGTGGAIVTLSSPAQFSLLGGYLDNLTFAGSNLNIASATIEITDGFNLSDNNLNLSSSAATIYFDGSSQTIDGLGIVATASNAPKLFVGGPLSNGPVTLTLGAKATISGNFSISNSSNGNTLLNNGTMDSNGNGSGIAINNGNVVNNGTLEALTGLLNIEPSVQSFTNTGVATTNAGYLFINAHNWTNTAGATISATNGGELSFTQSWTNAAGATISGVNSLLSLEGSWTNQGTIIANNCTVDLGGVNTFASLGNLAVTNSTVNIAGTINLGSNTLTLPTTTGQWNLGDGTINGGQLAFNGQIFNVNGNAALNGTRISGADLNISSNATLDVVNGLTVDTQNVNLPTNGSCQIYFDNNTTLENLNFIALGAGNWSLFVGGPSTSTAAATLTFGPNVNISGVNGFGNYRASTPGTIINDGIITTGLGYNGTNLSSSNFVNNGTINSNSTLHISANFTNNGTIALMHNSDIAPPSSTFTLDGGTLTGGGTIDGNLTISDLATLKIVLASGGGYTLAIDGNLALGGDLDVSFAGGLQNSLPPSSVFDILDCRYYVGAISGSFLNVPDGGQIETSDGFGSFQLNYGSGAYAHEVVLSNFIATVPEPAPIGLFGIGSFLLLRRIRRIVSPGQIVA